MAPTPQQRPGATIYSVAALAGVSIASVSRVLQGSTAVSDRTRVKVLAAAEQLNYVPLGAARSLAVRHHEAHGLVLPELTGPYYSELLMGFESRAAELGQSVVLMLAGGKADLPRAVRQLAARVDGMAMLGSAAIPESAVAGAAGLQAAAAHRRRSPRGRRGDQRREHRERPCPDAAPARPRPAPAAVRRRPRLGPRHPRPLPRVRAGPPRAGSASRAAEPLRIPFREADGTRFAERILAGEVRRRRAGVRQRRARAVDHGAVAGGRQGRPRGHRRRRLGRRDDRPLRPPRPHHGPPARARARRDGRGPAARAGHRRRRPTTGSRSCRPQLVLRASCGCPPAATGTATGPSTCDPHTV